MKKSFDELIENEKNNGKRHDCSIRFFPTDYEKLQRLCAEYKCGVAELVRALIKEKFIETFGEKS